MLFNCIFCECNRPSFLATVFRSAFAFNGDLNQWDVATVTTMQYSKSIRILENDLFDCRVQSGVWVGGDDLMLRWQRGGVEERGILNILPMAHRNTVCGL
jgi:hypothetical protein